MHTPERGCKISTPLSALQMRPTDLPQPTVATGGAASGQTEQLPQAPTVKPRGRPSSGAHKCLKCRKKGLPCGSGCLGWPDALTDAQPAPVQLSATAAAASPPQSSLPIASTAGGGSPEPPAQPAAAAAAAAALPTNETEAAAPAAELNPSVSPSLPAVAPAAPLRPTASAAPQQRASARGAKRRDLHDEDPVWEVRRRSMTSEQREGRAPRLPRGQSKVCLAYLSTGYLPLAAYYWLHATCCMLHATCYMLHATCYMLHAT